MNIAALILATVLAAAASAAAVETKEPKDKTERKNITVIHAEGSADGSSEITRETVKECIVSLPSPEAVEPEVMSDSRFLKEINGDPAKSGWTKVYTAHLAINYQVYRKEMLIVTTKSLEGREPTMKDVEKRNPQTKEFDSNPAEGDTYAGRSNRQYYFTTAEGAAKDVKTRAHVWLKQQAPLLCEK
jgi:hypothetical protein